MGQGRIRDYVVFECFTEQKVNTKYCLIGNSESNLKEFISRYNAKAQIAMIVDVNHQKSERNRSENDSIPVVGYDKIEEGLRSDFCCVIIDDYYKEIIDRIRETFSDIDGTVYYFLNRESRIEQQYRQQYRHTPLENSILFRSGPHALSYVKGMDFADNARALFEYMLYTGLNKKYKLIWLVKDRDLYKKYERYDNVEFLNYEWSTTEDETKRNLYYKALCLSKYLFMTDAYGFCRNCREDQIRVQLWHGCGFKTRVNFVRCEKRYEYTTVISDLYAGIHAGIYGLREDQILVTGYAKEDWLFQKDTEDLERLGIPRGNAYIFWMPTFRTTGGELKQLDEYLLNSDTGLPIVRTQDQMKELNEVLKKGNQILVIKLHPFQDRAAIHCGQYSNIFILENDDLIREDIPINRVLAQADAMISDYSSAAVDYLMLDRPMAFALEDVQEYQASRGFVFENIQDWLPGMELYSFRDFLQFIKELQMGMDSTAGKRRKIRKKMHKYEDGKSCERIVRQLGIV